MKSFTAHAGVWILYITYREARRGYIDHRLLSESYCVLQRCVVSCVLEWRNITKPWWTSVISYDTIYTIHYIQPALIGSLCIIQWNSRFWLVRRFCEDLVSWQDREGTVYCRYDVRAWVKKFIFVLANCGDRRGIKHFSGHAAPEKNQGNSCFVSTFIFHLRIVDCFPRPQMF